LYTRLEGRWRDEDDHSEIQGVLFPQPNLNPELLDFPHGNNVVSKEGTLKKGPKLKCETYIPPRNDQEDLKMNIDECGTKDTLFEELFSDMSSWEAWETAELKTSPTAGKLGSTNQFKKQTASSAAGSFKATKEDVDQAKKDSEDVPWNDRFSDTDSQQAPK